MHERLKRQLFALVFLPVFLAGCTIIPEPIQVSEQTKLVPFDDVANSQNLLPMGEKARWGGKIVSVENKKDVSEIEIVFFPESSSGKPQTSQPSTGRFKAVVEGFVDPIVFEQGRLITVVGEVGDLNTGLIGEQQYEYPTLNAMGYYMWKETTKVNVDTFSFSPFGHYRGFNRHFFNPWYDPWYSRNQRIQYRVDKYNGHSQGARTGSARMGPERSSSGNRTKSLPEKPVKKPRNEP